LPVVLMTGYSAAAAAAVAEGIRLVSKPFSMQDLSSAIQAVLHQTADRGAS
jgi:FixJ family two-component response regulator